MGRRNRLAVRLRQHGHCGHRQRQRPQPAAGELRPVHPDRRRDQSGQFRRAAVQHAGRSRGHQFADLQPHRGIYGAFLRDPDRCCDGCARPAAPVRPGEPRTDRRRDPGSLQRACRVVRPCETRGGARQCRRERRSRRKGRSGNGRHHSQVRRQAGIDLERAAADRRQHQARQQSEHRSVAQGGDPGDHRHRRRAARRPRIVSGSRSSISPRSRSAT